MDYTSDRSSHPLAGHCGFNRVFADGKLTIGFILPVEGYSTSAAPTMLRHGVMTKLADDLGFASLWARDVPLFDPNFGDAGQVFDPFTYLGFLAGTTKRIALATGSTVITLRHPLHVAKNAASIDQLSGGRMLLGVASGDRPVEYPSFGVSADFDTRGDRFGEAFEYFRLVTESTFPAGRFPRFGEMYAATDLMPKPVVGRIPAFVTGRSRQDMAWIAQHADGWFYYFVGLNETTALTRMWRETVAQVAEEPVFKPFAQGLFFDLANNPNYPVQPIHSGMRIGRNTLIDYLGELERRGVHHVALNLKASQRPADEVLRELAEYVLPHFPSHEAGTIAEQNLGLPASF